MKDHQKKCEKHISKNSNRRFSSRCSVTHEPIEQSTSTDIGAIDRTIDPRQGPSGASAILHLPTTPAHIQDRQHSDIPQSVNISNNCAPESSQVPTQAER